VLFLAAGLLDLGFTLFHAAFWRLFGWPERLAPSGPLNTAITQTLNLMLSFVFVMYGAALIWQAGEPAAPWPLPVAGGLFWLLRLALQLFWFDLRPLASRVIAGAFAVTAVLHLAAGLS
jgi:hypothetical protein